MTDWISVIAARKDQYILKQGPVGLEPKFILMAPDVFLKIKHYLYIVDLDVATDFQFLRSLLGMQIVVSHDLEEGHLSLLTGPENEAIGDGPTDVVDW
jgi:hypothetical protein